MLNLLVRTTKYFNRMLGLTTYHLIRGVIEEIENKNVFHCESYNVIPKWRQYCCKFAFEKIDINLNRNSYIN